MNRDALIIPYLEKDIRPMHQICLDIAIRDGTPLPDWRECKRRDICLHAERNHRNYRKKTKLEFAGNRL